MGEPSEEIVATRLSPGDRLGPYEIVSPIGSGGMAEVYRAKDTRLNRTVAIKVLRSHFSENEVLRKRFDREALAVSSLNHPNVCALYDVGHQNGVDFLVMEYLEGESLADRLEKGALPAHQLLRYGIEIADALYRAHKQGIIHRDLKPANIILTKSGVKLLDFGLAKMQKAPPESAGATKPLTRDGVVFGTPHYMSPEQLQGKDVDARTDIFALGVILYEMTTGKRPFAGESSRVLAELLIINPDQISQIPHLPVPMLDRIIRCCLALDPDERWQTAHDVKLQLLGILDGVTQTDFSAVALPPTKKKKSMLVAASGFLIMLIIFGFFLLSMKPKEATPMSLSILPPDRSQLDQSGGISIAPDGRRIAIAAKADDGGTAIWIRPLDSVVPELIPGTQEGKLPFWSPNNRYLGFFASGKLQKINLEGDPPQQICEASRPEGGTWNESDTVLFAPSSSSPIFRVSAKGGLPQPVTTLDASRQETSHRWPYFLPDGQHFLFTVRSLIRENNGIFVGSLDPKEPRRLLLADYSKAEYTPPGFLLFIRDKKLMVQPFDAKHLRLKGAVSTVTDNAGYDALTGSALFSASKNNILLFAGVDSLITRLTWVDRNGKETGVIGPPAEYHEPEFSPDHSRVVVTRVDQKAANNDLWLLNLAQNTFTRFTFDSSNEFTAIWSPDGGKIVFASNRGNEFGLYQKLTNGTGTDKLLLSSKDKISPDDWSEDGRFILYESLNPKTLSDLWLLPLSGDSRPIPFAQSGYNETHGQISPNGKWIAYTSDETGRAEVYVQNFPLGLLDNGNGKGGKWQISTMGGDQARWSYDGKELFFITPDKTLMAMEIKTDSTFQSGTMTALFKARVTMNSLTGERNQYLVSEDGRHFLINENLAEARNSSITALFNWPAFIAR